MAFTYADFKYQYRETLNNQVQPVTDWLEFTPENSTISGYNFSLNVGDINIEPGNLRIQTPNEWPFYGRILTNKEAGAFTSTQTSEPEPVGFPYTFPFNLA